jgi:hypothetical protein
MATEKHAEISPKWLDRRVVERYLKKGLLEEKELQKHLKALPDVAERAAKVETEFSPSGELGPSR